jgi:hypothetical protein
MAMSPHLSRTVRVGIGTVIVDDLALSGVLRGGTRAGRQTPVAGASQGRSLYPSG